MNWPKIQKERTSMGFTRWTVLGIGFYVLLGGFFEATGGYRIAEAIYKRGRRYAENKRAYLLADMFCGRIADTYNFRGDKMSALGMLTQRTESRPQDPMCYFDLGKFYSFNNQRELAIENYEKALQLETNEEWKLRIKSELDRLRT